MAEYLNKTREQITEMFLHALKNENGLAWKQQWTNTGVPRNMESGRNYRGINHVLLKFVADDRQYTDPRWCTFHQAQEHGHKIRKGEKGTPVEYWYVYDKKNQCSLNFREAKERLKENPELATFLIPSCKTFYVFNAEQMDGVPPIQTLEFEPVPVAEQFLQNLQGAMNLPVIHGGDRACYLPARDEVHLPEKKHFLNETAYYSTALHEIGHASGHSSRLDRELSGGFGSPEYAMEELRVEIASCMLSNELHLPGDEEHDRNHQAYVVSWISHIEKNPNVLMKAIQDAEGIADYLEEKGGLQECRKFGMDIRKQEKAGSQSCCLGKKAAIMGKGR